MEIPYHNGGSVTVSEQFPGSAELRAYGTKGEES